MQKQLLIGELAELAGVNSKTIRYYEDIEVLPAPERSKQEWRLYSNADVDRLRFVRGARALGIGLKDIREVLAFRDRGVPPCQYVLGLIHDQIAQVDRQISTLRQLRGDLEDLHQQGVRLPTDSVEMKDCVCHLVENRALTPALAAADGATQPRT